MKKYRFILFIIVFLTAITFFNLEVLAEVKTGYILPKNETNRLLSIGVGRGYSHDRQDLGIYMPANSSFTFCNYSEVAVGIELLNDGFETETSGDKQIKVTNGCKEIQADYDSVPFIRTPFSDSISSFNYEIKDLSGVSNLTIFRKGDNETNFINTWKDNNHKFAVITDDFIQFLVPINDISLVEAIVNNESTAEYKFLSINDMLNWYDGLITRYNMYIGSSFKGNENLYGNYMNLNMDSYNTNEYNTNEEYNKYEDIC